MAACSLRISPCNTCLRVSLGLGCGAAMVAGMVRIGALRRMSCWLFCLAWRFCMLLRRRIFRRGLAAAAVLVTPPIGPFSRILMSLSTSLSLKSASVVGPYALGNGVLVGFVGVAAAGMGSVGLTESVSAKISVVDPVNILVLSDDAEEFSALSGLVTVFLILVVRFIDVLETVCSVCVTSVLAGSSAVVLFAVLLSNGSKSRE